MITISPQTKTLVQTRPIDFRRGIDGLVAQCREVLREDPFSGTVFLFRNRSGNAIKILTYDGQGFWLLQKRFSQGKIKHWPQAHDSEMTKQLVSRELHTLLWNGNPETAGFAPEWKKISMAS